MFDDLGLLVVSSEHVNVHLVGAQCRAEPADLREIQGRCTICCMSCRKHGLEAAIFLADEQIVHMRHFGAIDE